MSFLHKPSLILGVLLQLVILLPLAGHALICYVAQVRLKTFALFLPFRFHMMAREVGHTRLVLGWLPYGGYTKPMGLADGAPDPLEADHPHSLAARPRSVTTLLQWMPVLTAVLAFGAAAIVFSATSGGGLGALFDYCSSAVATLFGNAGKRPALGAETSALAAKSGTVSLAFVLLTLVLLMMAPMSALSNTGTTGKEQKWKSNLQLIVTFALMWIVLWKLPRLVASYFSWNELFRFFINGLLGLYLSGLLAYLFALALAKWLPSRGGFV